MADKVIPEVVKEVFDELWQDLSLLELRWKLYRQLFTDEERLIILNQIAPLLFGNVQSVMGDDICLGLCRLTDPPQMGKYENTSLRRMVEVIDTVQPRASETIKTRPEITGPEPKGLSEVMTEAIRETEPFRELRNRALAHKDWDRRAEPFPDTTFRQVEKCLRLFRQIMNAVEFHYKGSTTAANIPTIHDGDDFFHYLKKLGDSDSKSL